MSIESAGLLAGVSLQHLFKFQTESRCFIFVTGHPGEDLRQRVRSKFHTNNMEGFWAIMKRGIYGIYHSVSHKHLHRYCNEFSYRYNTREVSAVERFHASLQKVSDTRIIYKGLIGK